MSWASLCELQELKEGDGRYVEVDGYQLAVFLHGGKVFVIDNYCPHAGGNLASGSIEDGHAVCPLHYWSFRLDNGQLRDSPNCKVGSYKSRLYERKNRPTLVQAELPIP